MKRPRIISGSFKGRHLEVMDGNNTRPTMERTRESVFNTLMTAPFAMAESGASQLLQAKVLDVFAGSGAYGFEALSRGAQFITFVENHSQAVKAIQSNIETLNVQGKVLLLNADARTLPQAQNSFDIVFMDPPYGRSLVQKALNELQKNNYVTNETLFVIETDGREEIKELHILDQKTYGKSHITYATLLEH